jgi:hypothetical protein
MDVVVVEVVDIGDVAVVIRLAAVKIIAARNIARPQKRQKQKIQGVARNRASWLRRRRVR